ncbi:HAMP domain-containing sensor histidine kinase [Parvibaculum sp.]|uniref:sensor histidine kinase n=1 Tax=Parvibaculum sp. TaxID=2024848 RepID=UPI0025DB507D|nr:HAMP domain-containing sensor histidine kinase [Parvibaculum sp.]
MDEAQLRDAAPLRSRFGNPLRRSLSRRLLVLTVLFVMLSEVLIFVPSIANFRKTWLEQHIGAAQIAALALEATPDNMVSPSLQQELLENAQVYAVSLHRNDAHKLMLSEKMPPRVDAVYDLRHAMVPTLLMDAFDTLSAGDGRVIEVMGVPRFGAGDDIEIIIDETPLRRAMIEYGINIFWLSAIISIVTASLIFFVLHVVIVRPMRRITENMVAFRRNPEDARRVIAPSSRADEIGVAERELGAMQHRIRATLNERARLAALGAAVSRINHDLRNILANAQLLSDRIGAVDDPTVRHLAPRLFASIDRAIDLCTRTLRFGSADEEPPRRSRFDLRGLVDEVHEMAGLGEDAKIAWRNEVGEGFMIEADRDHLFRILLNLGRNAVQAIQGEGGGAGDNKGEIRIAAKRAGDHIHIDVEDTGPGLPEKARAHLFEAFSGGARAGGTGLGLAIADELARGHGGHIELASTGPGGTRFRICIPAEDTALGCTEAEAAAEAVA